MIQRSDGASMDHSRTFGDLLGGILDHARGLARTEWALFSAEMGEKAGKLGFALVFGVIALAVAVIGIGYLLLGILYTLVALGLKPFLAAFILAVLCLVLAGALAYAAISRLKGASPVPRRTIAQMQKDGTALARSLENV